MTTMLLLKIAAAILGSIFSIYRLIRLMRMTEGRMVEGCITYIERTDRPLITFSYSVDGQRFHTSCNDTLDRYSQHKLREIAQRYNRGDIVPVWCAVADPTVCCIGERIDPFTVFKGGLSRLSNGLSKLFR